MDADAVLERLCRLPEDFRTENLSPIALVERSGVLDMPEAFTRERIARFLRGDPALVAQWEMWSDDQRCSPAWIFTREKGAYCVYRFPGGERIRFGDGIEACTEFIFREVESIAGFAVKARRDRDKVSGADG